ncbi:hypothetical protein NKH18_42865 [Streptomyces sp. M10(2022)]
MSGGHASVRSSAVEARQGFPVVAAAVQGRLGELLDDGVLLVEAGERAGAGAFARYRIRANSLGSVFLECLEGPAGKELLAGLQDTPEVAALRAWSDDYPPLPLVGAFLALVGDRVVRTLRAHPGATSCWVTTSTRSYWTQTVCGSRSPLPRVSSWRCPATGRSWRWAGPSGPTRKPAHCNTCWPPGPV